jgi:triacylglycerol lipase
MSKLKIPVGSSFEARRAMELANLIERSYQQYNHHKTNPSDHPWEPEVSRKLIGSTTCDLDLDNPSDIGKVEYQLLDTFRFTEYKHGLPETVPFGFIAQRKLESGVPGIFIVFRGTLSGAEWYNNFQFRQVAFLDGNLGQVSEGFNKIYTRSNDKTNSLAKTVIEGLEQCPLNSQVFITGHSLGGALATLATVHIAKHYLTVHPGFNKPILYTYASPRVGDKAFASYFQDLQCYRIANSEDLVVAVPPSTGRLLGPEMYGKPIPDDEDMTVIPTTPVTPARQRNAENIRILAATFRRNLIEQVYEHVGEPLYFTNQTEYLSTNHNMFYIYRKALP